MERIVVGIDGSEGARQALDWALDEGRAHQCAVEVVHAWQPPYVIGYPYVGTAYDPTTYEELARDTLNQAVHEADTNGLSVPVSRILSMGPAAEVVLNAAKGADLLVVGSRGMGGFRELVLGSVSHHVIHHASCPVVVVPPHS